MAVLPVATSASGLQRPEGTTARAGAAYRPPAHIVQKRLKKPCRRCKTLGISQGSNGQSTCGPPQFVDESVATAAQVLEFVTDQNEKNPPASENFAYTTTAGDLLVAAILTEGATITPPAGWQAVPGTDVSDGAGQRLQIFYSIPVPLSKQGKSGPESHSFTASAAEAMSGVLISVSGADQTEPINAATGAATGTPSADVTAPSIVPTAATTQLLFVGATGSQLTWNAPAGMKPPLFSPARESSFGLAYQPLRTATDTGARTATISSAAAGIGALIALRTPPPTACPKIRILNRHRGQAVQFKAGGDGYVPVRLKCQWSRRCSGVLGLMLPTPVASGAISVPAGKTRTVRLAVCRRTLRCARNAPRLSRRNLLGVQILLDVPNGQLVESTNQRDANGVLMLP
jgi:hypothetical protein